MRIAPLIFGGFTALVRADGACSGEEFPHPEDRRTTGFTVVPGLPAGGRRIVGIAAMSGTGCRRAAAAQVRRAKDPTKTRAEISRATRRFAQPLVPYVARPVTAAVHLSSPPCKIFRFPFAGDAG